MMTGAVAGVVSVLGYKFVSPWLKRKMGLLDTCGVHNLHGMPGLIGGICAVIAARDADLTNHGMGLATIFPKRVGVGARTAAQQSGYQLACIGVTLGFAIVGGLFTGLIASKMRALQHYFSDIEEWELPEEGVIPETRTEGEMSVVSGDKHVIGSQNSQPFQ
jgi:ammonium transporter Rh